MAQVKLTLQQAADALGVHYMTAYRYVRLGLLDAEKVRGTWRVDQSDVDAFRKQGAALVDDDTDVGDDRDDAGGVVVGTEVLVPTGRRRAPWAERFEARLLAGDARGAWGVLEAALSAGAGLDQIYLDVVTPALTSIGCRWQSGELDVSIEHRASVIVSRIIGRLGPRFSRRGRTRGFVVVAAPAGEMHSLPVAMLSDILRNRGWEVADLGGDVPTSSLARFVATACDRVVAVGLSVSTDAFLSSGMEAVAAIREVSPSTLIVLGGSAVNGRDHARDLGADEFQADARAFAHLLEEASLPA